MLSSASSAPAFAAADLGATSGRVVLGRVGRDRLEFEVVHRFANTPVRLPDGLHWDVLGLYGGILEGLRRAAARGPVASLGIDSWAVDYGLLDADGALLGAPFHYRDGRTADAAERVWERIGPEELYAITGLQHLPFNTVFQLAAAAGSAQLAAAERLLLIPDLLVHWLTGTVGAEATNASTTGLFDAGTADWSPRILDAVGIDPALLPPIRLPGERIGPLLPYVATELGAGAPREVVAVASHDTASAVAAVPADDSSATVAYVATGTWSLAGLELDAPVLDASARAANFTNERGVDGTIRFLRNIMGMWLLEECRRTWAREGRDAEHPRLIAEAEAAEPFAAVIDPDDPSFLAPGDMPARIAAYCRRTGQRPPADRGSTVRTILEALALAHARTLRQAAELSGRSFDAVHLVGGGARNELLCRLTADALGMPVVAGPVEATALGNILVQARAQGILTDRHEARRLIATTRPLRRHAPTGPQAPWRAAAARLAI